VSKYNHIHLNQEIPRRPKFLEDQKKGKWVEELLKAGVTIPPSPEQPILPHSNYYSVKKY
jgi:hypothetical protein